MRKPQLFLALAAGAGALVARAQDASADAWSIHGQSTFIDQWHYAFPSPYAGPNSFQATPEEKQTFSFSLYVARNVWNGACLVFDPEFFQGYGLSHTVGLGAYPSGEAIKSGFPVLHYNTSRACFQQAVGLGGPTEKIDEGADQPAQTLDVDRLVFTIGKFAGSDFFDGNAYSQDSRSQFMNGALLASGAWDEPGDVLGFTAGAVVQWNTKNGTLGYGWMMIPPVANGFRLDHHLTRAFGQMLEYDWRYSLGGELTGTLRPFLYWNRANMGEFWAADLQPSPPQIATVRGYHSKEGAGASWDQAVTADLGVFVRLSWNDGRTEDIAYADIDRSAAAGVSANGRRWSRPDDTTGLAGAVGGLSASHRRYLEQGSVGFTLGDGALNYGPEEILEWYYRMRILPHLFIGPDWQYIEHPGYNRDRGGFSLYAVRGHFDY